MAPLYLSTSFCFDCQTPFEPSKTTTILLSMQGQSSYFSFSDTQLLSSSSSHFLPRRKHCLIFILQHYCAFRKPFWLFNNFIPSPIESVSLYYSMIQHFIHSFIPEGLCIFTLSTKKILANAFWNCK